MSHYLLFTLDQMTGWFLFTVNISQKFCENDSLCFIYLVLGLWDK